MSGGALEYVYVAVHDAAAEVSRRAATPLQRAFAAHLIRVSRALHDLEWVFSGDYGEGGEEAAIRAVLSPAAELEVATSEAEAAYETLRLVLERVRRRPS